MVGAAIQRCRVHFLRNVLASVPKGSAEMVAAAIRTIFAQPDAQHVHEQLDVIAGMLGRQFPRLEAMLSDSIRELLAFTSFPISTGRRSGPRTPWSASTRRSSAAPTSWVSFPTPRHCSASPAPYWSKPTTNGRSATAATYRKAPWPCSQQPPRRWRQSNSCRHRLPTLIPHGTDSYTTPRDVTPRGRQPARSAPTEPDMADAEVGLGLPLGASRRSARGHCGTSTRTSTQLGQLGNFGWMCTEVDQDACASGRHPRDAGGHRCTGARCP
jgi:Transposase, Mutator family